MRMKSRTLCAAAVILLAACAGCAFIDDFFNLGIADSQYSAIDSAASNSPSERIQAEATEARRGVFGIYGEQTPPIH
jgi:hypothetical protein